MRSRTTPLVLIVLSTLFVSSCGSEKGIVESKPVKVIEYNVMSGREGSNGPILVTKIDDTVQAHPQIGLDLADIVYIEQVEGGLTRLAALFSSVIPDRVGPVRSARISDIDLLAQFGHVAFTYSGAQSKMLPVIAAADLINLGAQRESAEIYQRDITRSAPVNLVLNANVLMQKLQTQGENVAHATSPGWTFGEAPLGGSPLISAKVSWPANSYTATWSEAEERWLLSQRDLPDLADSGKQLGATTFVIQKVLITPSIYHDKAGGITPFSATVGIGTGYILRDGKSFAANWQRATAQSPTTWTLADGTPIAFAPGQVWVALTDTDPVFTRPAPSASPSPTK
ncbi:MAG: DUF3048 domain-containing protein [Actinobacteria bacterium]|nr:DUF3048 domain-containing protein [Actinomycetota bacterium]